MLGGANPEFSISASAAPGLPLGGSNLSIVTVTALAAYAGAVNLIALTVPNELLVSFA